MPIHHYSAGVDQIDGERLRVLKCNEMSEKASKEMMLGDGLEDLLSSFEDLGGCLEGLKGVSSPKRTLVY